MDKGYAAPPREEDGPAYSPVKGKRETQNAKLTNLSSQVKLGGADPNDFYHKALPTGQIVDFRVSGLKPSCDELDLKRAVKVRHVISTELDCDNFRGICKGTGRIKCRLGDGESIEQVRENLERLGYTV